jgi:acyl transferase domain-containing protein
MYTRWGGFVRDAALFDAGFFGISPREAEGMDPQQRMLLETSWEALEYAGIAPSSIAGTNTGVYVGISATDYGFLRMASSVDAWVGTGNAHSVAAGRLSYVLGLRGPSIAVDTACSSSLVSVHLASQALRARECDLALAAGVNLIATPTGTLTFCRARMMAPDGRCKTFDAAANGYVRGEGCGVVVLKRLSDALAGRDNILAVIRGSAVNQDGASGGLTVPNGPAQEEVIRRALAIAGVKPFEVGYVEAHGTGMSLGDPIEVRALANVLCRERNADEPLLIGSVKTNIGHLESAAGIASLIKVVLALRHREIPPHLHFQRPSPHIAWEESPIGVPAAKTEWTPHGPSGKRIAGISSFSFCGTNAHLIVEEAPDSQSGGAEPTGPHTLVLSARTEAALSELVSRYAAYLAETHDDVADICYTANTGRSQLEHTLAVVGASKQELRDALLEKRLTMPSRTDWESFYQNSSRRKVRLPNYPFERERYWFQPSPSSPKGQRQGHPLLGEALSSPLPVTAFASEIGTDDIPYLASHRAGGVAVLPAAAYLDMVLAARPGSEVADVLFLEPMFLTAQSREVQVILHPQEEEQRRFEVFSRDGKDAEWSLHASGSTQSHATAATEWPVESLDAIRSRCASELSVDDFYDRAKAFGLDFGPDFRAIRELRCGEGEAFARIALPANVSGAENYRAHPVLLDAAL